MGAILPPTGWLRKRPNLVILVLSTALVFIVMSTGGVKHIPHRLEIRESPIFNRSSNITPSHVDFKEESTDPCTFQLLRSYFSKHRTFVKGGEWFLKSEPPYFQPSFCKFKYPRIPATKVSECLLDAKVRSIMTIGDSNGQKNFNELQGFLPKCKMTLNEPMADKFMPKVSYFLSNRTNETWTKYLDVHYRLCGTCKGTRMRCTIGTENPTYTVNVEHIPLTMVVDDSMRIHMPKFVASQLGKLWAPTTQEFTFRYFLKGRYPDIFIVLLPFNHAKHLSLDRLAIDIEYFKSLAKHYFPKRTKFVYIPAFAEFEKARTGTEWVNKTFEKMLATEKIDNMNKAMFKILSNEFLDPSMNHYGFFDLLDISKPVGFWSQDGIHMKRTWYSTVMSMFWETFCNSVSLDAF